MGVIEWTKRILTRFEEPLKHTGIFGVIGLPILRAIYEEFLLPNKDLTGHNKYPATVAKLLRIHTELCEFHKVKHIYYDLWDGRYLSFKASSYHEDSRNGQDVIDMGLPKEDSKFLVYSVRCASLRSIMDLAQAHANLQRQDTGANVSMFLLPIMKEFVLGITVVGGSKSALLI
ncbi:hypothetical protein Cgig2_007491 [Carnegiea gigantea]|uniref:Uncharacterized protein n=1 Tax=Carnegiea gigantea TaxID=171969 RepID=A0A9Q1JFP8_9CARY|nr:hypothetical protein Cgig2_007491 [Carnegiea gigantea]